MSGYKLGMIIEAQNNASKVLKTVSGDVKKLEKQHTQTFDTIKNAAIGLGITAGFKKVAGSVLTLAGNLEQAEIAFTTMLGSAEDANNLLDDLSKFAARTPFELTGIRDNAKQLLAMGISTDDLLPTLKSLGDVSAGLSVPLERLALNYGQVISQGRLTGREMRDFTMAGVPLLDELSRMLGKSNSEIQNMISRGEITSDIMVEAFKNMSSEGGKFADLMDAQSGTFQGSLSNMQDALSSLGETVGRIFLPVLTDIVQNLVPIIDKIGERAEKNPGLATAITGVATAMVGLLGGLTLLAPAIGTISTLLPILTAALTGPAGLVIAVGIAAISLGKIANSYQTNDEKIESLKEKLKQLNDEYNAGRISMQEYENQTKLLSAQLEEAESKADSFGTFLRDNLKTTFRDLVDPIGFFNDTIKVLHDHLSNFAKDFISFYTTAGVDAALYFRDVFLDVFHSIRDTVSSVVGFVQGKIEALSGFFQSAIDATSSAVSSIKSIFGGGSSQQPEARATGGPVSSGNPYIVGEKGPELFVPKSSGNIVPNHQINDNQININISGISVSNKMDISMIADELARQVDLRRKFNII